MSRMVASAGGAGFVPVAPGTFGSLLAVLFGTGLLGLGWWVLACAAAAATVGGWWAVRQAVTDPGADPGWVVVDEVAGQWIAMLAVPSLGWPWLLAAFALFRLFDITKPGPVGWADRQTGRWGGAWGIMADDVLAGASAAVVLLLARWVLAAV